MRSDGDRKDGVRQGCCGRKIDRNRRWVWPIAGVQIGFIMRYFGLKFARSRCRNDLTAVKLLFLKSIGNILSFRVTPIASSAILTAGASEFTSNGETSPKLAFALILATAREI